MDQISEEVRRFLHAAVHSIDELEILRLLGEQTARSWSAEGLVAELQISLPAVTDFLTALHARGLLTRSPSGTPVEWRYGPASPELEARLASLLQVYRERPVSMIKAVYARPAEDPLRSFADAFRLRKED